MALKIKLARLGANKKPVYRVIVTEARSPRDGRFLERIGWYDPRATSGGLLLDLQKVQYWIERGACPTEKVKSLIKWAKKETPVTPDPSL